MRQQDLITSHIVSTSLTHIDESQLELTIRDLDTGTCNPLNESLGSWEIHGLSEFKTCEIKLLHSHHNVTAENSIVRKQN